MGRLLIRCFFCSSSYLLLSSLELSDTQVYEPEIRAILGTASHFCQVVVYKLLMLSVSADGDEPVLEKSEGTEIVWAEGKNVTVSPTSLSSSLLLSSLELSDTKVYEP